MKILSVLRIVVTSNEYIYFQPKEQIIYAENKGSSLENSSFTKILLKHELAVPNWMKKLEEQKKKASLSLWSVRLDVQKNWQAFLWKLRWLSSLIIHKSFKTRFTNTAKTTAYRLSQNSTTRVKQWFWKVSMR